MHDPYTTVYSTPITKLEYALWVEARRQLHSWWPSGESDFWVDRVALFAVVGDRALPGTGGGVELHKRVLARFNETACLEKPVVVPQGWRLVPCLPTEEMLQAGLMLQGCLANLPDPPTVHAKSLVNRLQSWFAKRRQQGNKKPSAERNDQSQYQERNRTAFTTIFLAMVEEAPLPPWARG